MEKCIYISPNKLFGDNMQLATFIELFEKTSNKCTNLFELVAEVTKQIKKLGYRETHKYNLKNLEDAVLIEYSYWHSDGKIPFFYA